MIGALDIRVNMQLKNFRSLKVAGEGQQSHLHALTVAFSHHAAQTLLHTIGDQHGTMAEREVKVKTKEREGRRSPADFVAEKRSVL